MAGTGGITDTARETARGATDTTRSTGEKARGVTDTAHSSAGKSSGGILGGIKNFAEGNPATKRLADEASNFAQAKGRNLMSGLTDKVTGLTKHLDDYAESGGSSPLFKGVGKMAEGKSPATAAVSAGVSSVKDKVAGKVKDVFGTKSGEGGNVNVVSIVEEIDIGAPRSVVYNQWTQFAEFPKFTQGVRNADQQDPTRVQWRAKIFWSKRTWEATITEQVPDHRIAWKSSGDKGTVDGAVTFHELTPDLTKVILQLEYKPQGLFERTGNLWRAQGRRARLDLKHFRRYVMMRGEETGAWRGEIRDGEVVRESDEDQGGEQQGQDRATQNDQRGQNDNQRKQNEDQRKQNDQRGRNDRERRGRDETGDRDQRDGGRSQEQGERGGGPEGRRRSTGDETGATGRSRSGNGSGNSRRRERSEDGQPGRAAGREDNDGARGGGSKPRSEPARR